MLPDLAWYWWPAIAWPLAGVAFWLGVTWRDPWPTRWNDEDAGWASYLTGVGVCMLAAPFMLGLWGYYAVMDRYAKNPRRSIGD